ncbi:hypothetical protein GQ53DRAFT_773595 [Thozetella sp. PMI_491]|nr:hypothetical protein GQ53DRAFT_773595 [Thozetella sp. PMI_491]
MGLKRVVLGLALVSRSSALALDARGSCNGDNCLRAFQKTASALAASSFCSSILATTLAATATPAYPTFLANCGTETLVASCVIYNFLCRQYYHYIRCNIDVYWDNVPSTSSLQLSDRNCVERSANFLDGLLFSNIRLCFHRHPAAVYRDADSNTNRHVNIDLLNPGFEQSYDGWKVEASTNADWGVRCDGPGDWAHTGNSGFYALFPANAPAGMKVTAGCALEVYYAGDLKHTWGDTGSPSVWETFGGAFDWTNQAAGNGELPLSFRMRPSGTTQCGNSSLTKRADKLILKAPVAQTA